MKNSVKFHIKFMTKPNRVTSLHFRIDDTKMKKIVF